MPSYPPGLSLAYRLAAEVFTRYDSRGKLEVFAMAGANTEISCAEL